MEGAKVEAAEIARFGDLAAEWWNPRGPMRALHRMNALRVGWIRQRLPATPAEIRLLDVGCGAGLASESLARAGFTVLGIDASAPLIAAARAHAPPDLPLRYRIARPEDLASDKARFEAITALEVIEHVADPNAFVASLAALLAPGGRLFLSTLNRTARSFLMAKIGAEYILRLLPRGTHDWRRFITTAELQASLARSGLRLADIAGMRFDPLRSRWEESRDTAINYIVMAEN